MTWLDGQTTLAGAGLGITSARGGVRYIVPVAPRWALDLVEQVATDYPVHGELRPRVEWKPRRHAVTRRIEEPMGMFDQSPRYRYVEAMVESHGTSGACWPTQHRILIRAGKEPWPGEHKMVLLHELAHWLSPAYEGHGIRFWRQAWELFVRYLPEDILPQVRRREGNYKRTSERAFRQVVGGEGDTISLWTGKGLL